MTAAGWATLAAWIALLPIAGAAARAYIRSGQAESAADRAEQRAETLLEQYQRMADALERMAEADAPGADPALAEGVSFTIELNSGDGYTLRNLGPGRATCVRIDDERVERVGGNLPGDVDLGALQGHLFIMAASLAYGVPTEAHVVCDQIPGGVYVPIPTRG